MKNFTINGYSKSPLGEVTNNQTMMCIVTDESTEVYTQLLLIKTSDKYYKTPMELISEEEFNSFFIEVESERGTGGGGNNGGNGNN